MNEYGYPKYIDYDRLDNELSRTDLALLAIVLGFFAAILATSLGNSNGLGDLIVRGGVTAILTVSAIASVRGAVLWGSSPEVAKQEIETAAIPRRAYEIDLFHTQSGRI